MPDFKPKKSHFKAGLLAGALFGLAAGIFMTSKQGKQMAKDLQAKTKEIQARLLKELKKTTRLSEKTYAEAIDRVLVYYTKTRRIAAREAPVLRRYLVSKWREIERELKAK